MSAMYFHDKHRSSKWHIFVPSCNSLPLSLPLNHDTREVKQLVDDVTLAMLSRTTTTTTTTTITTAAAAIPGDLCN
jgi:hypothetical protein